MRVVPGRSAASRIAVAVLAALVIGSVALFAAYPPAHAWLAQRSDWLAWYGRPGSFSTLALAVFALGALCYQLYFSRRGGPGKSITIVVVLSLTSFLLAAVSYAPCNGGRTPFFTQLIWGAALMKGGMGDPSNFGDACPVPIPVALELARVAALTALLISLVGIAAAVFRSRMDRVRVYFANSVTAVVGVDEDAQTLLGAVAATLDPGSTLVVLTENVDGGVERQSRILGARVIAVDLDNTIAFTELAVWRKLTRLYLLSPDPWTNLQRLSTISDRLTEIGRTGRIPVIVRIDDPWQAEAWRATQFGGADRHWVADAIGMYEVTARRLLDRILTTSGLKRIVIAGSSPLTLALLADLARRQAEHDFYPDPRDMPLPAITLVAENSDEYREDHERHRKEFGLQADNPPTDAVTEKPSVRALSKLLSNSREAAAAAVIFVDSAASGGGATDPTAGIRLASRFPATLVYACDPKARVTEERQPLVGKLRTFRLAMDLPKGSAHDAWERAARLIHERYAAQSPTAVPWSKLSEFYRGSNRRLVIHALGMVEAIGEHTWSTRSARGSDAASSDLQNLEPLEQLERLGFHREAALKMVRAEHEDWCRYYRGEGWNYGPVRDDAHQITDQLVDWAQVESDPARLRKATASVADTLLALRELGYRSRPVWERFRRSGTVVAERRDEPFTWTSATGDTMHAVAGDWAVEGADGSIHSVADDIFRATHTQDSQGRWTRTGIVEARPSRLGEVVDTLEGPVKTADGDWVVRGAKKEMWPVPAAEFARTYEGPLEADDTDDMETDLATVKGSPIP
jgi:hypothetical protein